LADFAVVAHERSSIRTRRAQVRNVTCDTPLVAADRVIAAYWEPGRLPVEPMEIAKAMGIRVEQGALALSLSAALIKEPDEGPKIVIEASESRAWKRHACAYEIGHFLRHKEEEAYHLHYDKRHPPDEKEQGEAWAWEFAVHLLIPQEEFYDHHANTHVLWELAREFGVSPRLMQTRLESEDLEFTE
jgi:Zn-dependent peptidase ImmA (M78 family)